MCVSGGDVLSNYYRGGLSFILGIVVIVIQVIAIGLNIGAYFVLTALNDFIIAFPPLWTALPIILFGAFAIASGKSPKRCLIIAHLVLAIIASVFALVFLIMVVGSLAGDSIEIGRAQDADVPYFGIAITLDVFLVLIALAQFVFTIVCAVLCCKVLCCIDKNPHENSLVLESAVVSDKLIVAG